MLQWVQSSREDVPPPAPIPPSLPSSCVCPGCSLLCVALSIKAGAGPVVSPVLCCLDIVSKQCWWEAWSDGGCADITRSGLCLAS